MGFGRPVQILLLCLIHCVAITARGQDDSRQGNPYFPSRLQPSKPPAVAPTNPTDSRPAIPEFTPPPDDGSARVRYAIPDMIFQTKAEAQIKNLYRYDYADTKPLSRRTLATKLLRQAMLTNDDPAIKY